MTLDVFHCLVITVPYHYVADWRKYLVKMQHTNGRGNIDAIDRVGVATDSNLAKGILFVYPQKLPESVQLRLRRIINGIRTSQGGIGVVDQTPSLERDSIL